MREYVAPLRKMQKYSKFEIKEKEYIRYRVVVIMKNKIQERLLDERTL